MKDIVFNFVKINNFLSIGNTEVCIHFKVGLNGITGFNYDLSDLRSNGVGKSTIVDAIYYAFYGTTLRKIKSDGIKNYITQKTGLVVMNFKVNNDVYEIQRKVAPHKLELYINGELKTLSTIDETTEFILKVINCSSELFRNSVLTSINDTVPFMAQDAKLKRKFSEGILNIAFISNILKSVRDEYNSCQKTYDLSYNTLENCNKNIKTYTDEIVKWKEKRDRLITSTQDKITEKLNRVDELKKNLTDISNINSEEISDNKKSADNNYQKCYKKHCEYASEITSLEKQIKTLNSSIASIESINSDELLEKKKELDEEYKKLSEEVKSVEAKVLVSSELDKLKKDIKEYNKKLVGYIDKNKDLNYQIQTIESRIEELNATIEKYSNLSGNCPTCHTTLDEKHKEHIAPLINELKESIKSYEKSIEDKKSEIKENDKSYDNIVVDFNEINRKLDDNSKNNDIRNDKISVCMEVGRKKTNIDNQYNEYLRQQKYLNEDKTNKSDLEKRLKEIKIKNNSAISDYTDYSNKLHEYIEIEKRQIKLISQRKEEDALVSKLESEISYDEKQLFQIQNAECSFESLLEEQTEEKKKHEEKIASLDEELKSLEILKNVFSEEGAKTYITKKIIKVLNDKINYYLTKLQFKIKVTFDEFFEDTIKNHKGEECSYFNFSGAERKSIDIAVLFAFIDLRKAQGDVNINTLFFDELLDSSMDKTGISIILDILKERVEKYNECIYVISHRKESLSNFSGEVIELEKRNGITTRII